MFNFTLFMNGNLGQLKIMYLSYCKRGGKEQKKKHRKKKQKVRGGRTGAED